MNLAGGIAPIRSKSNRPCHINKSLNFPYLGLLNILAQISIFNTIRISLVSSSTLAIMQFAFKNLALISLFVIAVSGASKFADTCQNIEASGSMIRAECRENENGQLRMSQLDLNRCIKNSKGSLQVSFAGSKKIRIRARANPNQKSIVWQKVSISPA